MHPANSGGAKPLLKKSRRGITLVEMLVASTVVAILVGAMGMMALGVRTNQSVSQTAGVAQQHARVILNRMRQNITSCTANLQYPGFVVFSEQVGVYTYPDVLVIWNPASAPANPNGLPLWNEVIIYATDPDSPHELYEITIPSDSSSVPPLTDLPTWQTRLSDARQGVGSQRLLLTELLRIAKPDSSALKRGALRFAAQLRPSATEMDSYIAGTLPWSEMRWVQDLYSPNNGLRQNWCTIEMQLRGAADNSIDGGIPFVTSAVVYFQVERP